MQALTAYPREHLTEEQVKYLLTCDNPLITTGLELLDGNNRVIRDISDQIGSGGQIRWDNRDAVHGSASIPLLTRLAWGRDRVRPYREITAGGVTARFNRGVFIPTRPVEDRAETPATFDTTCYDLMSLFQNGPADTWVATAGTTYYAAVTAMHAASDTGTTLLLPGELKDLTLPATRVWAVMTPVPSWLRMMTDLLLEVGYTAPWADENGTIRTRPIQDVAARASEWTFDVRDKKTNLVYDKRTLSIEAADIANWWRFVWSDKPGTPVEGDGIYTVENLTTGEAAQEALDRVVRKFVPLQAESHASLVAQGDKIVSADIASARTLSLSIDPLPIMGFDDVVTYIDTDGAPEKVLAASWNENLDGSAGDLQLGGAPREPLDEISSSTRGTITDNVPMRVVVDGGTVDSFANALDGAVYDIGDRVTVSVRNPLPPLVQGVES